jgi:cytochrome c553
MKRALTTISILAMALASGTVMAGGNAAAGKEKSTVCASCHGPTGDSTNPQFPKLAGQYEDYIVRALSEYKSGARKNPIMKGFAAGLSEQDMENLAAYFSSQKPGVIPPHI